MTAVAARPSRVVVPSGDGSTPPQHGEALLPRTTDEPFGTSEVEHIQSGRRSAFASPTELWEFLSQPLVVGKGLREGHR